VCPIVVVVIVATVSAYTDANVACANANDVPDAFVDGGYAAIDDALNGGKYCRMLAFHFAPMRVCCGWENCCRP